VSRAPLPNSGVTSVGETWSVSWESITPPSSLILAHSPLPLGSLLLRLFASVSESLQVVTSPCCPRQLPDVIPRTFPWMLDPLPRRYTVCSRLFLPRCHRPSPTRKRVGFPHLFRLKRLLAAELFEDADISLCSGLQVCSPPRSSLPLRTPAGQPGLLHPSRTRFVASPRIGYANRLKTGNWRYRDFHPVRLSVLSAAPSRQFSYPLPFRGQVCETQSSLPCFPSAVLSTRRPPSLDWVPVSPVPQRHEHYEGATTPTRRLTGHLFGSLPVPTRFLHASCSPMPALSGGWRSRIEPGSLFDRRSLLPVHSHVDVSGTSQVPRRSFLRLCPDPRPRPNRRLLAVAEPSMLPLPHQQQGLQRAELYRGYRGA
jgi:hypothetical protein